MRVLPEAGMSEGHHRTAAVFSDLDDTVLLAVIYYFGDL
jgi:hypothetical protein